MGLDVKPVEVSGKPKSAGMSCLGKPKGTDLDGEYKASADVKTGKPSGKPKGTDLDGEYKTSADVKLNAPEGDINAELPSADASIAVKSPELDVKPVKVSGKPKSAGMSCF